jgi:hypothetical protein
VRRTTTLVLALGALALAACGGADSSPHAADGPSTASAVATTNRGTTRPVPWADLPATHPHLPSTLVPRRPDPSPAEAARPCRAGDLVMRDLGNGAAAGTMVKNLRFSLAPGHRPCAVSRRPRATLRTVEGATVPGLASGFTSTYHRPVLLTPTAGALAQLVWPSACFATAGQASVTLTYAGRTWTVPMGSLSDRCDFGADRPLRSIGVTHFVPPERVRARRVTSYTRVRTRGPGEITARIDRPVTFVVTLTSPRDLVLDPCPDYRLSASIGSGGRSGLNCSAVPYRDAESRPYLPAGQPVSFEMRIDPGGSPLQKYFWTIVGPGRMPYAAGVLTLR